ncbi:hypothetical protein F4804DRAFT_319718 [Jackrogersella minutella]|nr:hypothetical protein F4804DRAFT_319718 [Jackrogersella minutella]
MQKRDHRLAAIYILFSAALRVASRVDLFQIFRITSPPALRSSASIYYPSADSQHYRTVQAAHDRPKKKKGATVQQRMSTITTEFRPFLNVCLQEIYQVTGPHSWNRTLRPRGTSGATYVPKSPTSKFLLS